MTNLFAIGHLKIGNFLLWITEPVFTNLWIGQEGHKVYSVDRHLNLPYYSFSLVEIKDGMHYYINLVEKLKEHDKYFDFVRPDKKVNDEVELNHWSGSKDQQMPLWYLRKDTVQKIINMLIKFEAEGKSFLRA
jgi:hypothetical protein